MRIRLSQSLRLGPVRLRISEPLGRGRVRVSAGTRTPLGWLGVSATPGKRRRRSR